MANLTNATVTGNLAITSKVTSGLIGTSVDKNLAFTAVADGLIPARAPVVMQSDGKVKAISYNAVSVAEGKMNKPDNEDDNYNNPQYRFAGSPLLAAIDPREISSPRVKFLPQDNSLTGDDDTRGKFVIIMNSEQRYDQSPGGGVIGKRNHGLIKVGKLFPTTLFPNLT